MPLPTPETEPFWAGLEEGEIRVPRCGGCGRTFFYPRSRCPGVDCHSEELEWVTLPPRGSVYSYTVNRVPGSPAFEAPYGVCLVELEGGVRMVGRLVDSDLDDLAVGAEVEAAFESLKEGDREQTILCFKLAGGDG
jgi:uncharacterized protein